METKLSRFILVIFFLTVSIKLHSQFKYNMSDIYIDNIRMKNSLYDYSVPLNCKIIKDSIFFNDEIEMNIRNLVYFGDSLFIYCNSDEKYGDIFTYYIEIKSSKHLIKLKEKIFYIGMTMLEISKLLPEISEEYNNYLKRNEKNCNRPIYIGIPLIIENKDDVEIPYYTCQGLKFQILSSKIINILVDFRSDGDFD